MQRFVIAILLSFSCASFAADHATGKIVKVLPLLLDTQGHIAKSPSLFDRDAYQAWLREHTNEVSGIRYDVQWSAKNTGAQKLKLRVELRGLSEANLPKLKTLETEVAPGYFRQWTGLTLSGDDYQKFGAITAWRATLWNGDQLLGEQKSFLW